MSSQLPPNDRQPPFQPHNEPSPVIKGDANGGANVAFHDGITTYVRDIGNKRELIRALATYNGGEPVGRNDLWD